MLTEVDENTELSRQRTAWSRERTQLSIERTFLSLFRTGMAIAGGGALITSILTRGYPDWIVATIASIFVVVGFGIMIVVLQRYVSYTKELEDEARITNFRPRTLVVATLLLQGALVAALVLFLLS